MAEYAKDINSAFQSYYKLDGGEGRSRKRVRPICGDYLANVALKKRRKVIEDTGSARGYQFAGEVVVEADRVVS